MIDTKTKKLFTNSIIFTIANFSTKIFSLLMVVFYTYIFSTETYGKIDLIVTTITLCVPLVSFHIQEGIMRFSMDKNYDKRNVFSTTINILNRNFIFLLAVCLFLILLFRMPIIFLLFLFVLFSQCYYNSIGQFIRGIGNVKVFAFGGVFSTVMLLLWNIILLLVFKLSIIGYLLSLLLSYVFTIFYFILRGKLWNYYSPLLYDKLTASEMIHYCLPLIPNSIMWWIVNMSDRYMILILIGSAANGIYAVANKIPSIVSIITNIFFQAWQITVIEEHQSKDKEKYFSNIFNYFMEIIFIINSIILLLGKPVISILISSEFYDSWKYVPCLLFASIFSSFSSFLGAYYAMSKKTIGAMLSTIVAAIVNIVLNLILIPTIGINGAAIATMVSMLLLWIIRIFDTKKFVNMTYNLKGIGQILILQFIQLLLYYNTTIVGYIGQFICLILLLYCCRKNFGEIKKIINMLNKKHIKKQTNTAE